MADAVPPSGSVPKETPRRVIVLEETVIEGRIQKPQAFYILQRAALAGLERGLVEQSFLPKIIESVERDPF